MKNEPYNEERLVRYLLGEVSVEEQLWLEEQFFADEDLFEQLSALEHQLRYDYARGRLTPRQRELFEKRFITSSEERRGVERAGAILDALAGVRAENTVVARESGRQGFRQAVAAFFSSQRAGLRLALATASLLLVAMMGWLIYQTAHLRSQLEELQAERRVEEERLRDQTEKDQQRLAQLNGDLERERLERERLEQELAKQQTQNPGQPSPTSPLLAAVLSFVLPPGGVRGDGEKPKPLVIPQGTNAIQLELQLKKNDDHRSFRAQLLTADGKEIWRRDNLQPRGRNLILRLLAELLADGDYEVALKGRTASHEYEEAGSYYFTIVKK